MKDRGTNPVAREILVLLALISAGVVWVVAVTFVVPFCYEFVSRVWLLDYSYLWNGLSDKVRQSAIVGPAVLLVFYVLYLAARIMGGLSWLFFESYRRRPPKPPRIIFTEEKTPGEIFRAVVVREIVTVVLVLALSWAVLYTTRNMYFHLKQQYFSEIVGDKAGFQNLSTRDKERAMAQYEELKSDEFIGGMMLDYGFRARLIYRLQHVSFWFLIWGYPAILVLRAVLWAMKVLREED